MANPTSPSQPGKAGIPPAQAPQPEKSPAAAPAVSPLRNQQSPDRRRPSLGPRRRSQDRRHPRRSSSVLNARSLRSSKI